MEYVATMQPYDCACIFCGKDAGAPARWHTVEMAERELRRHATDCLYLQARELVAEWGDQ